MTSGRADRRKEWEGLGELESWTLSYLVELEARLVRLCSIGKDSPYGQGSLSSQQQPKMGQSTALAQPICSAPSASACLCFIAQLQNRRKASVSLAVTIAVLSVTEVKKKKWAGHLGAKKGSKEALY